MRGPGGKKEVSVLAWPLAIGMLSFTVMGVTDTLLMGHVGTDVQAGVGLATTKSVVITSITILVGDFVLGKMLLPFL